MELEACFTAILDGDLERFTELLEQHPDALKSFRDHSKSTLLHASVGKPDFVRELIYHGVNVNIINRDDELLTSLHFAALEGCLESCRLLLDSGADVSVSSSMGTPLHCAVTDHGLREKPQRIRICELFLKKGADINATVDPKNDSWTALHQACTDADVEAVKFLLEQGANPNLARDGMSPLFIAIGSGNDEISQLLQEFGAKG